MPTYEVTWTIDVEEDTPTMAALVALDIQRDLDSEALAFTVKNKTTGEITEIDIGE